MTPATHPQRLSDLPLWRLFVLLDDAERTIGPDSETTITIAGVIRDRMGTEAVVGEQRPIATSSTRGELAHA